MLVEHLRSFHAVAKHLGLRPAATERHLTQSAVSKQLKSLQRKLGVQLYARNGRGVVLTEAGRVVLSRIEPILKQLDALEELFRAKPLSAPTRPSITVAASYGLATRVMNSMVARFERQHPEVEIRWDTGTSNSVQKLVHDGQVAVALSGYRPIFNDLVGEPFRIEELVFFVHPRHPLARRPHVTLREVLDHPLVIRNVKLESTATHDILEELAQRGYSYKVALWCNEPLLIREGVARNVGVGISFLENLREDLKRGRFIVLKGSDFHFTTLSYIVYRKHRELSPLAQEFLQMLRLARRLPGLERLKTMPGRVDAQVKALAKKSGKSLSRS